MLTVNPVIRGFSADPSVIRVDDWYYASVSTMEWFPTLPLYRSPNLADWEFVGSVDTAVPRGDLLGVPSSAGVWAPSLSYSDGVFWITYSIVRTLMARHFDLTTYVSTTSAIGGPWSAPFRVPGHGFDPSLFHMDGHLYLLNLYNDCRVGGKRFAGIVACELQPEMDSAQILTHGQPHLLLRSETLLEGPKMFAKDGWFYLLLAEGGTGWEHGVRVARSRSVYGPYELDAVPLLTSREDPSLDLAKAGHGEIVTTPDGSYLLAHLASRPLSTPGGPRCPLGRETCVQNIEWIDEWPRLAGGGHTPSLLAVVPNVPPPPGFRRSDSPGDFSDLPGWPWSSPRRPVAESINLVARPGWVRLRGAFSATSLWDQALVAQRLTEFRSDVAVVVDASPETFTQAAGLILFYNDQSYYSLDVTWAEPEGEAQEGQQWAGRGRRVFVLEHGRPDGTVIEATADAGAGPWNLGARIEDGWIQFSSGPVGGPLTPIGPPLDLTELSDDFGPRLRFTGVMAGIHAMDLVDGKWTADFSDWSLTYPDAPPRDLSGS